MDSSIKSIDVIKLKEMMDAKEEFKLIDCREADEFETVHIEGSVLMPLSTLEQEYSKIEDQNEKIIVLCQSGMRSQRACHILKEKGFTDLTIVEGGVMDWMDEGFDTKG